MSRHLSARRVLLSGKYRPRRSGDELLKVSCAAVMSGLGPVSAPRFRRAALRQSFFGQTVAPRRERNGSPQIEHGIGGGASACRRCFWRQPSLHTIALLRDIASNDVPQMVHVTGRKVYGLRINSVGLPWCSL